MRVSYFFTHFFWFDGFVTEDSDEEDSDSDEDSDEDSDDSE